MFPRGCAVSVVIVRRVRALGDEKKPNESVHREQAERHCGKEIYREVPRRGSTTGLRGCKWRCSGALLELLCGEVAGFLLGPLRFSVRGPVVVTGT